MSRGNYSIGDKLEQLFVQAQSEIVIVAPYISENPI